jgi:hypothetical protein
MGWLWLVNTRLSNGVDITSMAILGNQPMGNGVVELELVL